MFRWSLKKTTCPPRLRPYLFTAPMRLPAIRAACAVDGFVPDLPGAFTWMYAF